MTQEKLPHRKELCLQSEASLTGKLMYPLADLFLVQWEDMLKVFPKAIYAGGIF